MPLVADTPISISAHDDVSACISKQISKPFYLEELTWDSDAQMQSAEFNYLVDIAEHTMVNPEDLIRAVTYLHKKNKFERIVLTLSGPDGKKQLHMELQAAWTFKRLKLHGFMLGKEAYRHCYGLEPGERFDKKKHEHGIAALKQALHDQGYVHAQVTTTCDYDDTTKSVTVHVTLARGTRYTFGASHVVVHADKQVEPHECEYMRVQLGKKARALVAKQPYIQETQATMMQRLRRFLAEQGFLHVSLDVQEQINHHKEMVNLTITVDLHRKKECVFMGNHAITREELFDALLLFGDALWMVPASMIQEELMQVYIARGFLQAHIQVHEDETHYTCIIDEGERAYINAIRYNHVQWYDHEYLTTTYGSKVLNHYYDEQLVQQFVQDIISAYIRDGFLDARMVKTSCVFDPAHPDHYTLSLTIDEGHQAHITAITIDQFPGLSSHAPFVADTQLVCTQQQLEKQRLFLLDYCHTASSFAQGSGGQGQAQVNPELRRVGTDVHVHWKVHLHPDTRTFGKTILVTDTTFPFEYITRELRYNEGEVWDDYKVQESLERLKALDIFESVHLYPATGSKKQDAQPMILKVYEDDPYELRTRLGFGLQNVDPRLKFAGVTYIIGATALARNVGNHAGIIQADVDITRLQRNFQLRYVRPWLFNKPIKTELQGYSNHYWQPGFVGIRTKLYEVVQHGFLLELTRFINTIRLGLVTGIDGVKTVMSSDERINAYAAKIAHAINFKPRLIDKTVAYLIIQPTLVANYVDDNLNPRQGSLTVATVKGVIPLNRRHEVPPYLKVLLEQSLFIPVDPLVIAFRARVGHIFRADFSSLMPNDRFYLGGANSIRSYESDLCPPVGIFENDKGRKQVVPQGGKTMANINVELRFPLLYKNLGAVAFQDLGILSSNKLTTIHAKNILAATGFGLRLNTPIGPLRFDIGWKWKCDDPYTHNYMWFLTFGHAF